MRIPARTRARPWACTRISVPWSYLHGFAHTCTGMRIPIRVCAHLHGHAHGPWSYAFGHAFPTRPAAGLRRSPTNPAPTNTLNQRPAYSNARSQSGLTQNSTVQRLGGMGVSVRRQRRRRDGRDVDDKGGPAPACVIGPGGPMVVGLEGPTCSRAWRLDRPEG